MSVRFSKMFYNGIWHILGYVELVNTGYIISGTGSIVLKILLFLNQFASHFVGESIIPIRISKTILWFYPSSRVTADSFDFFDRCEIYDLSGQRIEQAFWLSILNYPKCLPEYQNTRIRGISTVVYLEIFILSWTQLLCVWLRWQVMCIPYYPRFTILGT